MSSSNKKFDEKKLNKSFEIKWFQRNKSHQKLNDNNSSRANASMMNLSGSNVRQPSGTNTRLSGSSLCNRKNSNEKSRSGDALKLKLSKLLLWDPPHSNGDNSGDSVPFPNHSKSAESPTKISFSHQHLNITVENTGEDGDTDGSQASPRLIQELSNLRRRRKTNESRSRSSSLALSFFSPSSFSGIGNISGSGSLSSSVGSSINTSRPRVFRMQSQEEGKQFKISPLPPPPTATATDLEPIMNDNDAIALGLDPHAVLYADHLHTMGCSRNRFVCASLSQESSKEEQKHNSMVMQAFIMRMMRFNGEPIDMSLRKFLYWVALPVESQQIERVLKSFSVLWDYQNPGIFRDNDQVLQVVYALVMLHTDAFNDNVKRKISKVDFVRNATVDGIEPEIFEYFYDNITIASFISDEDSGTTTPRNDANLTSVSASSSVASSSVDDLLTPRVPQIISEDSGSVISRRSSSFTWLRDHSTDPYTYLLENRLEELRPDLQGVSTQSDYDIDEITSVEELHGIQNELYTSTLTLPMVMSKPRSEFLELPNSEVITQPQSMASVVIVKSGILLRRENKRIFVGQKPGWKEWSVLLTNSNLYLVKNTCIARQLDPASEEYANQISVETLQSAQTLSTTGMAAVLRSPRQDGQLWLFTLIEDGIPTVQHSFAVQSAENMKSWIQAINYVATQSTVGIDLNSFDFENLAKAQKNIDEQIQTIQHKIDSYDSTIRQFQLMAPIHSRTRESLVYAAGKYFAKRDEAIGQLTRLRAHGNVLKYAF